MYKPPMSSGVEKLMFCKCGASVRTEGIKIFCHKTEQDIRICNGIWENGIVEFLKRGRRRYDNI